MNKAYKILKNYQKYFETLKVTANENIMFDNIFVSFLTTLERIDTSNYLFNIKKRNSLIDLKNTLRNIWDDKELERLINDRIIYNLISNLKEEDVISFNFNSIKSITQILRIKITTGSILFKKQKSIYVNLSRGGIMVDDKQKENISNGDLEHLKSLINQCHFECWQDAYFNRYIKDGHQWKIEIIDKKSKEFIFTGSNSYPIFYGYIRKIIDYCSLLILDK